MKKTRCIWEQPLSRAQALQVLVGGVALAGCGGGGGDGGSGSEYRRIYTFEAQTMTRIAIAPNGDIYDLDLEGNLVRFADFGRANNGRPVGMSTAFARPNADANAFNALRLSVSPTNGQVYSTQNGFVQVYRSTGEPLYQIRLHGRADTSDFIPQDVSVGNDGTVFVVNSTFDTSDPQSYGAASYGAARPLRFSSEGELLSALTLSPPTENPSSLGGAGSVAAGPDSLYVANRQLYHFSAQGDALGLLSLRTTDGQISVLPAVPWLGTDAAGNIYVGPLYTRDQPAFLVYGADGTLLRYWTPPHSPDYTFAVDAAGRLYFKVKQNEHDPLAVHVFAPSRPL